MLHVFTYSTSELRVQPLLASASQHGLTIKNLATTTTWNGLQDKLLAMVACLNELPPSDIVCFVDAYDVIANCSSNELLARFKAKNMGLWIGAEINMEPGDAAIYLGCEIEHWREEFKGDWHAQTFLHYVDKNGINKEWFKDKRQIYGIQK